MTYPEPSFGIDADATNPGQFFACCGLLELAHRRWPGAEGWFDASNGRFAVIVSDAEASLERFVETLKKCEVSGLTTEERAERDAIEEKKRNASMGESLPEDEERRRRELGEKARKGALRIGGPFSVLLDWWQARDDEATPKTWAGRQEIHKVARAAQDALPSIDGGTALFDHGCVLRVPEEYRGKAVDGEKPVEPFYFDSRRFAHSLDAGFSLDVIEAETIAHPAVELLSLIGLQRFRPAPAPAPIKWNFDYWTWSRPLGVPVAAGVAGGVVPAPGRVGYRFPLRFRDDQKRYKAFGRATGVLFGSFAFNPRRRHLLRRRLLRRVPSHRDAPLPSAGQGSPPWPANLCGRHRDHDLCHPACLSLALRRAPRVRGPSVRSPLPATYTRVHARGRLAPKSEPGRGAVFVHLEQARDLGEADCSGDLTRERE